MSASLLDVNVLVALAWPNHVSHALAGRWFSRHASQGWATCPITQMGLVRTLSNPSFSEDAITPSDALLLLERSLEDPSHQFWSDRIGLQAALELTSTTLHGHKQITDAYLLGLALRHKGKLATLDRGMAQWAPATVIEIIA